MQTQPTGVHGGDAVVVLNRYSTRAFTLSCPVKVCVCPSEGAETGSWMTLTSVPDVTAQLGCLMTEGPCPAHTCPSWAGQATSQGERGVAATLDGQMFWNGESGDSCSTGSSVFLLSPVIENHVKGQSCDTSCTTLHAGPFSKNMTKPAVTG